MKSPLQVFYTEETDGLKAAAEKEFGVSPIHLRNKFLDNFHDGEYTPPYIVVGPLTDQEAAFITAKGARWCQWNKEENVFERHVVMFDATNSEPRHYNLGPHKADAARVAIQRQRRPDGFIRKWWNNLRDRWANFRDRWKILKTLCDGPLWLAYLALILLLAAQAVIVNSVPFARDGVSWFSRTAVPAVKNEPSSNPPGAALPSQANAPHRVSPSPPRSNTAMRRNPAPKANGKGH